MPLLPFLCCSLALSHFAEPSSHIQGGSFLFRETHTCQGLEVSECLNLKTFIGFDIEIRFSLCSVRDLQRMAPWLECRNESSLLKSWDSFQLRYMRTQLQFCRHEVLKEGSSKSRKWCKTAFSIGSASERNHGWDPVSRTPSSLLDVLAGLSFNPQFLDILCASNECISNSACQWTFSHTPKKQWRKELPPNGPSDSCCCGLGW